MTADDGHLRLTKIQEALALARQIAEALEAAHENGIVRRDLKPANIVLQGPLDRLSSEVRPRVLDFGLAKPMMLDQRSRARAGMGRAAARNTIRDSHAASAVPAQGSSEAPAPGKPAALDIWTI